ncbi:MAG: DUF2089 domain-containing protein, partial [Chitinophagales bacterium]
MTKAAPSRCPVCQAELEVKRLECPSCGTGIDGRFGLCKFCRLAPEHREFMEVFLVARGNIKEVERLLGISYPTVRGKLNALLQASGYPGEPGETPGPPTDATDPRQRKEVLEAISRGELSV